MATTPVAVAPASAPTYPCSTCDRVFRSAEACRSHTLYHHGEPAHRCGVCDKAFVSPSRLRIHAIIHTTLRPFACTTPGCRFTCNTKTGLRNHKMTHVALRPFQCPECPYSHHVRRSFEAHMNKHRGLTPYACPHCAYTSAYLSNLRSHIKARHMAPVTVSPPPSPQKPMPAAVAGAPVASC